MIPGNANPLLLASAAEAAAVDANITKSLRINRGDSAHLSRTPSSTGNRRTFTFSAWVKRSYISTASDPCAIFAAGGGSPWGQISFTTDGNKNHLDVSFTAGVSNGTRTTAQFRDGAAWYHIVVAVDTTQATASDRIKMYVNGVHFDDIGNSNYPAQNYQTQFNNTNVHRIGAHGASSADQFLGGYLADIYFIDGTALGPTSFGAYDDNGVWQAAGYSGTYGTNGFHLLDFANESTVGHDSSGNNNDFTANNISTSGTGTDVLFDVPQNGDQSDTGAGGEVSGNYCTWNPSSPNLTSSFSQGALTVATNSSNTTHVAGTIAFPTSGKWYWEVKWDSGSYAMVGVIGVNNTFATATYLNEYSESYVMYSLSGGLFGDNSGTTTGSGATFSSGDLIGVALDLDNQQLRFYKNGTQLGGFNSVTISEQLILAVSDHDTTSSTFTLNTGQRAFTYAAPSGYKALCTTNLPTPTIADGSDYFDAKLYTGNSSTQSISGYDFSPDLVWIKNRNDAYDHELYDTVRGVTKRIMSSFSGAEDVRSGVTAFNSDGFSLGSAVGANESSDPHVAWAWDAGSSTASNTNGSITSSVRASQTSGFSIVSYTGNNTAGATIGHGLSAAPEVVFYKNRSRSENWGVYSKAVGATKSLYLNLNQYALTASSSPANMYNSTDPSNSVLTVGDAVHVNANGEDIIAYCFAPVTGFSSFGVYTGNGNVDGPFVYTGFRPAFVMVKRTNSTEQWAIGDTARDTYNPVDDYVWANASSAEDSDSVHDFDYLSNGFKLRYNHVMSNGSGSTYLYMAFAENPLQANGGLAR